MTHTDLGQLTSRMNDEYCNDCDGPCDGCCRRPLHTIEEQVAQAISVIMSNSPEFIEKFRVKFLAALNK